MNHDTSDNPPQGSKARASSRNNDDLYTTQVESSTDTFSPRSGAGTGQGPWNAYPVPSFSRDTDDMSPLHGNQEPWNAYQVPSLSREMDNMSLLHDTQESWNACLVPSLSSEVEDRPVDTDLVANSPLANEDLGDTEMTWSVDHHELPVESGSLSIYGTPDEDDASDVSENQLYDKLEEALVFSAESSKDRFLPLSELHEIINRGSVFRELSHTLGSTHTQSQMRTLAVRICNSPDSTFRKTFAILVLIECTKHIESFINEGISDRELPLVRRRVRGSGSVRWTLTRRDDRQSTVQCIGHWSRFKQESFDRYQWSLVAPYFSLAGDETHGVIRHYVLDDNTVLPFTESSMGKTGGFSRVWRVKIHPAHHNLKHPQDVKPSFAVKQLHSRNLEEFEREVQALKYIGSKRTDHIIQLLMTYAYREDYYLLFPWADGNLWDFWRTSAPTKQDQSPHRSLWVAKQCLGLSQALHVIHNFASWGDLRNSDVDRVFGRHGDLKPENILYFKDSDGGDFRISDFGLTRFHSQHSKSLESVRDQAVSLTYRAPEFDMPEGRISRSSDVWALGCIFLEFILWHMCGWDEVVRFSERRAGQSDGQMRGFREDVFFSMHRDVDGLSFTLNSSVREVHKLLHHHPLCSAFLHDFLDLVENELLVTLSHERSNARRITVRLRGIVQRCHDDQDYLSPQPYQPELVRPERLWDSLTPSS
jgi:serine/threonine protein kinase